MGMFDEPKFSVTPVEDGRISDFDGPEPKLYHIYRWYETGDLYLCISEPIIMSEGKGVVMVFMNDPQYKFIVPVSEFKKDVSDCGKCEQRYAYSEVDPHGMPVGLGAYKTSDLVKEMNERRSTVLVINRGKVVDEYFGLGFKVDFSNGEDEPSFFQRSTTSDQEHMRELYQSLLTERVNGLKKAVVRYHVIVELDDPMEETFTL